MWCGLYMKQLCTLTTALPHSFVQTSARDMVPARSLRFFICLLTILTCLLLALPAAALVKFDFEQKYYVHPGRQVWDFCVVRSDTTYHLFYHSIHELTPSAVRADTIWHTQAPDLSHWSTPEPVLTSGPSWWDGEAIWAPDVLWDDYSQRWSMAYTGVDSLRVQRPCMAHSPDLFTWTKERNNPVITPDSMVYYWSPTTEWSDFRDPFLFYRDGDWNMLSTAKLRVGGYPGTGVGILQHSTSSDLIHWSDAGVFFENDGDDPGHVLESSQFHDRGDWLHIYFGEYDVYGISHIASSTIGEWHMADREIIDWGGAPEIKQFDTGIDVFGRMAAMQIPQTGLITYVIRFDTLTYDATGATPDVLFPHPLDANWAEHVGQCTLGNPTFGDNTLFRGDETCGLVGNGWFGSKEYYQGPLSGRGSPGTMLGDFATGRLTSHPFYVTGDVIDMLVGGGNYPETCYIALVVAETDSILLRETGQDQETMTPRRWDVRPYQGQLVYIQILDAEQGEFGHINVDEIEELILQVSDVSPTPASLVASYRVSPNPFNPQTNITYTLSQDGLVRLAVYDLLGRKVAVLIDDYRPAGPGSVIWDGRDASGSAVASGVYIARLETPSGVQTRKLVVAR